MHLHIANATIHIGGDHIPGQLLQLPVVAHGNVSAEHCSATPAYGELWEGQGGYYVGVLPALGDRPAMHMIASAQEGSALKWGPYEEEIAGASCRHDGRANTRALMAAGGQRFPAAWWAQDLQVGPLDDFHLPSQTELFLASLYAPQLFKKEGWYWSSTQLSRDIAFAQVFEYGGSGWYAKDLEFRARAFRWIPLNP